MVEYVIETSNLTKRFSGTTAGSGIDIIVIATFIVGYFASYLCLAKKYIDYLFTLIMN